MSVIRKLAGATAIYGISSVLGRFISILLTPIHTGFFTKGLEGQYGILSFFFSYIAFFNVFLIFGMETTLFRLSEDEKEKGSVYNQAFLFVSGLAVLFLLIGMSFHDVIAGWIGYPDDGHIVMLVVGILTMDTLAALPMARLRQQNRAKRFATINIINIVLTVSLNFILLKFVEVDIVWVFVANVIASAFRMGMAFTTGMPSSWKPKLDIIKPMTHYGFFIMIAGLAGMMNETLDRILIPNLWESGNVFLGVARTGEEMNGIYAACYKLGMFIPLFTQAFRYAAEPFFFKNAVQKDSPETLAKVFHYFFFAVLAGFLIISAFKDEIAAFNFFGLFDTDKRSVTFIDKAYWDGLSVVPILLMAYVCSAIYVNLSIWFKITKQTRFALLFTGVGALITILINVFTIPTYGFVGSAWATLICYAVMVILVYFIGQHYYPVPYRVTRLGQYLLLVIVGFGINRTIGATDGFLLAFVAKMAVCAGILGLILVWEKWYPSFKSSAPEV
ncbi:MAG: lipopolysaccharide biosynthesis protein [Bacteroidia bacterium]